MPDTIHTITQMYLYTYTYLTLINIICVFLPQLNTDHDRLTQDLINIRWQQKGSMLMNANKC